MLNGAEADDSNWDDHHFTLTNIPYGIGSAPQRPNPGPVTRIYNHVYFLQELMEDNLLPGLPVDVVKALSNVTTLNAFAAIPSSTRGDLRAKLQQLFWDLKVQSLPAAAATKLRSLRHPVQRVRMHLPVAIGDFSDFCAKDHLLNAGEAVLGTRVVPPGFPYFPVGYTGRCSSIVISGTQIPRPCGWIKSRTTGDICFGPSRAVDFELEVAAIVSQPTLLGQRVNIQQAEEHIFGLVLLNDWSARDIQGLEMNPLGPFNGKSFGTTISPWIVTLEAIRRFRTSHSERSHQSQSSHEQCFANNTMNGSRHLPSENQYNINLRASLQPSALSTSPPPHTTITNSSLKNLSYSFEDLIVYQTSNGCPLRTGDLLATGTVSGPDPGTWGCLLEITRGGKQPVTVAVTEGEPKRVYLEDGDGVRLTGWAGTEGGEECVGFGESWGVLVSSMENMSQA